MFQITSPLIERMSSSNALGACPDAWWSFDSFPGISMVTFLKVLTYAFLVFTAYQLGVGIVNIRTSMGSSLQAAVNAAGSTAGMLGVQHLFGQMGTGSFSMPSFNLPWGSGNYSLPDAGLDKLSQSMGWQEWASGMATQCSSTVLLHFASRMFTLR